MAKELGITNIAMPTNGNAGAALAAYCSRVGVKATVLCPDNTPTVNVEEIAMQGAATYRVNGARRWLRSLLLVCCWLTRSSAQGSSTTVAGSAARARAR